MLVILRVCPWSASFLTSHSILRCCQLVERRKRDMVCQPSRLKGRSWTEKSLPAFPCSRVHSTTTTHAPPRTHIFCVLYTLFILKKCLKKAVCLAKIQCWGQLSLPSSFPQSWNKGSCLLRGFSLVIPGITHIPSYIQKPWRWSALSCPAESTAESNTEGRQTGRGPRQRGELNRGIQSTGVFHAHLQRRSATCQSKTK